MDGIEEKFNFNINNIIETNKEKIFEEFEDNDYKEKIPFIEENLSENEMKNKLKDFSDYFFKEISGEDKIEEKNKENLRFTETENKGLPNLMNELFFAENVNADEELPQPNTKAAGSLCANVAECKFFQLKIMK